MHDAAPKFRSVFLYVSNVSRIFCARRQPGNISPFFIFSCIPESRRCNLWPERRVMCSISEPKGKFWGMNPGSSVQFWSLRRALADIACGMLGEATSPQLSRSCNTLKYTRQPRRFHPRRYQQTIDCWERRSQKTQGLSDIRG